MGDYTETVVRLDRRHVAPQHTFLRGLYTTADIVLRHDWTNLTGRPRDFGTMSFKRPSRNCSYF